MNLVEFNRKLTTLRNARSNVDRNKAKFALLEYYEEVTAILLGSQHTISLSGWDEVRCGTCHVPWPCPTIANLTGVKAGE